MLLLIVSVKMVFMKMLIKCVLLVPTLVKTVIVLTHVLCVWLTSIEELFLTVIVNWDILKILQNALNVITNVQLVLILRLTA